MSHFRCRDCNSLITTSDNIRPSMVVDGYGNPIGCMNCGSHNVFREFDQIKEETPEGAPKTNIVNNSIPHPSSNSKSEDTPPEPPQDTSLDEVVEFLCGSKPLQGRWFGEKYEGIPVYWWRNHLRIAVKQSQAKLLQVIEDEVIQPDEQEADGWELLSENVISDCCPADQIVDARNILKAEQRLALKKIKDNVINGGSL